MSEFKNLNSRGRRTVRLPKLADQTYASKTEAEPRGNPSQNLSNSYGILNYFCRAVGFVRTEKP